MCEPIEATPKSSIPSFIPPISRRELVGAALIALFVTVAAPHARGASRPVGAHTVPRTLGPKTVKAVAFPSEQRPGTILVNTSSRTLYLITGAGQALAYQVGIGREGFGWTGVVEVSRMAEWPSWRPTPEMRLRRPELPDRVPPGPLNPLGARAIYLSRKGIDTLYRIHGTNETESVGGTASSGCFRLTNADIIDLYGRVRVGARVVVY